MKIPIFHVPMIIFVFELRFKVGIFQTTQRIFHVIQVLTSWFPFQPPDLRGFTVKSREIQLLEGFFENHQPMKWEMYEIFMLQRKTKRKLIMSEGCKDVPNNRPNHTTNEGDT